MPGEGCGHDEGQRKEQRLQQRKEPNSTIKAKVGKGRSGVHAVEEYGWSHGKGDSTVLFELDGLPVDAPEQTEYVQHLPA